MNVRKIEKFLLVWLCIITLLLPFGAEVLAAIVPITSETETTYLETVAYREGGSESSGTVTSSSYDESSYSYEVSGVDVLKIVQEDDYDYSDMIYCINAMGSFPTSASNSFLYTNVGDFTDETDEDVIEWKEKVGISDEDYDALVYLLNIIYLMKQNTSYKTEFIETAFADLLAEETTANGYVTDTTAEDIMTYLTDDDIDVIQQWAMWYFTNGSNSDNDYYNSLFTTLGTISVKGVYYSSSSGVQEVTDELTGTRLSYAKILYNYLIDSAESAVADGYSAADSVESVTYPSVDTTETITSSVDGSYYKVGPYKVNSGTYVPSDYSLTLTFNTSSGTISESSVDYKICDSNGTEIELSDWEFDTEYYIYVPVEDNTITSITLTSNYTSNSDREITLWTGEDETGTYNTLQEVVILTEDTEEIEEEVTGKITEVSYDLALRKFVVSINGEATEGREPVVSEDSLQDLADGTSTTAEYLHSKSALTVTEGDTIIYEIRIYNEGDVDATVESVVDYLPDGLSLVSSSDSTVNSKYNWVEGETTNGYTEVTTDYLSNIVIPAFDADTLTLSYAVLQIECEISEDLTAGKTLTNVAEIIEDDGADIDSNTESIDSDNLTNSFSGNTSNKSDLTDEDYYYKGLEDDDDFEKVVIEGDVFDLALQKFISEVNGEELDRDPEVDVSSLNNGDEDATYTTTKTPVTVETGDIVTFTIRIYNEGDIDGYADEITDYIPEGLGFLVNYQTNYDNYWSISDDATSVKLSTITNGEDNLSIDDFVDIEDLDDVEVVLGETKVTSTALSYSETSDSNLISAFDGETLSYKDVQITCIVVTEDETTLKNIAAITGEKDEDGIEIETDRGDEDIDSSPTDDIDPDSYTTGNEDDDDYDVVKTSDEDFDLALQKFISALNDEEITDREPVISTDSDGNLIYSHTSEALSVGNGDYVTYTIRIYNEGEIDGYVSEISDDIPTGLVFDPDNETNIAYDWVMYDSSGNVTEDSSQAVTVKTTYLSKETSEDNLIAAFNSEEEISSTNPAYKEVKIVFLVDDSAISATTTTEERTITNTAEITAATDSDGNDIQDIDSTPGNNDPDEDDIDTENVYVKYFDLALEKELYSAIVTVDGESTQYYVDEDEETIRVEVNRNKVSSTTIKFIYYITITNEGEIAGYATEITDYIPDGLYFDSSDNSDWTLALDNVITTNALAKTLLEPGESATVQVVLTWTQDAENTGKFVNIAEISDDWNEYDSSDIDSVPNNMVETEDDYDTAPVYVSISTGLGNSTYIILTTVVLTILGSGIVLIKKYVI